MDEPDELGRVEEVVSLDCDVPEVEEPVVEEPEVEEPEVEDWAETASGRAAAMPMITRLRMGVFIDSKR